MKVNRRTGGDPDIVRGKRRANPVRGLRTVWWSKATGKAARVTPLWRGTMTTTGLSDLDITMKDAVMRQLEWDPEVDATAVGVSARNGAVTLTGYTGTYAGKLAAERAAKRVRGVRAVANDIEVRLKLERVDADLAADVVRALELYSNVPDAVQAAVHHGYVTLTGQADWMYQKRDAEKAVRHVRGVRGVLNHITIAPQAAERNVRHRIIEAFHRNANLDSRNIAISVSGDTAILTGTVGSWLQRESAERAACDAPGIAHVDNRITVESQPTGADEVC